MVQQPFLSPEAAGIAYEIPFRADHAVAGNDDGYIVPAIGRGGGADAFGIAQPAGHVEVAEGFAEGDRCQLVPDLLLEGSTILGNGKFKDPSLSLEILDKLFDALDDHGRDGALQFAGWFDGPVEVVYEADLIDIRFRSADAEEAQGRLIIGRYYLQRSCHYKGF